MRLRVSKSIWLNPRKSNGVICCSQNCGWNVARANGGLRTSKCVSTIGHRLLYRRLAVRGLGNFPRERTLSPPIFHDFHPSVAWRAPGRRESRRFAESLTMAVDTVRDKWLARTKKILPSWGIAFFTRMEGYIACYLGDCIFISHTPLSPYSDRKDSCSIQIKMLLILFNNLFTSNK